MDVPGAIPLEHNWPKWWGKLEIYESDLEGPALIIDLDTVFIRPLVIRPEHENEAIVIRDCWRDGTRGPERLGGGFMYLPQWARKELWAAFDPSLIAKHNGDDQPFLHSVLGEKALRFQDHYLDEVVSYKAFVRSMGIQPETKVVYFHGVPRPWNIQEPWVPSFQ